MSAVVRNKSVSCIVELDEPAVEQAFAPGGRVFYENLFESAFLPTFRIKLRSANTNSPNIPDRFYISFYNESSSDLSIVSFNGTVIENMLLVKANDFILLREGQDVGRVRNFKAEDFIHPETKRFRMAINIKVALPKIDLKLGFFENLIKMKNDREFTDAVLVSNDQQEFPVHRNVLAAKSDVFRNKFLQGDTRRVAVDLNAKTLEQFINFFYTTLFEPNLAEVLELMMSAEFYKVNKLRKECETFLAENLKIETVALVWMRSDQLSATNLKNKATAFIAAKYSQVRETPGWAELRQNQVAHDAIFEAVINLKN